MLAFSLPVTEKWYNHNPETDVGNDQVTLIWEIQVHAYREAKASIPDIINKDHIL